MSRSIRRAAAVALAFALVLAVVVPAFAYNEQNVRHVRLVALDPIRCGSPIRLEATVDDGEDSALFGVNIDFSFKKKNAGDLLAPTSDTTNQQGKAHTTLTLAPSRGVRQIVATVRGTKVSDQLTISARAWPGCGTIVLPPTSTAGGTGSELPNTSTALDVAVRIVKDNLPLSALLVVAGAGLLLAGFATTRRARRAG